MKSIKRFLWVAVAVHAMASAVHAQDLSPEELRFLDDPYRHVDLCINSPTAFTCGSYALMFEARDRVNSDDRSVREAAARALSLTLLARAVPIRQSLQCGPGGCEQPSNVRCGTGNSMGLSLLESGMRRVLADINQWGQSLERSNEGGLLKLEVDEGPPADYGFQSSSRTRLKVNIHAELQLVGGARPRTVRVTLGYATTCPDGEPLVFGSSVLVR